MTEKQEKQLYELVEPFLIDNAQDSVELVKGFIEWYEKQNSINKVKEFMLTTAQPINNVPTYNSTRVTFRLSLILEELRELAEATHQEEEFEDLLFKTIELVKLSKNYSTTINLKEVLDALLDLRYVTDGALHEFGLANIHDQAFDEVHKSNMSKFSSTHEEAEATFEKYQNQGIECYNKKVGDLWITYRVGDHKVLKSINYKEPELNKFISKTINP